MPDLYTMMLVNKRIKKTKPKLQQTNTQRAVVCFTRSEFEFLRHDVIERNKYGVNGNCVPVFIKQRHGVNSSPR